MIQTVDILGDTLIPVELRDSWFASDPCPACGVRLRPVTSFDETHYLCDGCGRCWRVHNAALRSVDPVGCHGCTARHKHDCLAQLQCEFPRFGPDLDE
jgi:hypothetical protein